MNRPSVLVTLLLISILAPAAGAAIVDNGTFTTDTATGLDWLDTSYTDGLSYNQALALISGGSLSGWRFATSAEFDTLINSAVGAPYTPNYFDPAILPQMQSLISLFGYTYNGSGHAFAVGYVDSSALTYADARQFGWSTSSGGGGYVRPAVDTAWDQSKTNVQPEQAGGFLVRASVAAVPEPASLLVWSLLGLTLGGATWWRRRNAAA